MQILAFPTLKGFVLKLFSFRLIIILEGKQISHHFVVLVDLD